MGGGAEVELLFLVTATKIRLLGLSFPMLLVILVTGLCLVVTFLL